MDSNSCNGNVWRSRAGEWGGNEVPVEGENEWILNLMGGEESYEVPVEGRYWTGGDGRRYCDDVVMVSNEQIIRLCIIVRILTSILTMSLVLTGYVCAMYDVLQVLVNMRTSQETTNRAWVVCGAVSDGGVNTASTETMVNDNDFDHNTSSLLNGSNNEAVRRGDITLEPEDGEQKTQDDGDVMQFNLEQTDESIQ